MGMFDIVRCEFPLSDTDVTADENFQTKDLDNAMGEYIITAEGHLLRRVTEYRLATDGSERMLMGKLVPAMERVDHGTTRVLYHGDIRFYTGLYFGEGMVRVKPDGVRHDGNGGVRGVVDGVERDLQWEQVEYVARFTEGVCVWIKRAYEVSY